MVAVFELEKRGQLLTIELMNALAHVMREHKLEEGLLFCVEARTDGGAGTSGPLFAGQPGGAHRRYEQARRSDRSFRR